MPKKKKQISQLPYIYGCPECGKRIFDSAHLDDIHVVGVQLKCMHCSNVVDVELTHKYLLKVVEFKLNILNHTEQRSHIY